jgi:TonB family protein
MSEVWKQWQGQIVDGRFALRQYLGGSEFGAVFATERGEPTQKAAIKFIQVDEAAGDIQLSRWKRAAALSHPHLLRVFESGRCSLGDFNLLYVVMEYAEENLAQFLQQRPLTPAEARDVLAPALDALAYMHAEGLIHGHVRPSNIMAIEDCLKLSADGIYFAAQPAESSVDAVEKAPGATPGPWRQTPYDAPESADGNVSPAADIWSLGMTLVEMLTQRPPVVELNSLPSIRPQDPQLPDTLPAMFLDIARNCLRRDPQQRWTVTEISARLHPTTPAATVATQERSTVGEAAPAAATARRTAPAPTARQAVATPRSEVVHQRVAPARPPLHAQTVGARDSLGKPRYDLAPPHLQRPPLMPKASYLVLGAVAAVTFAAILVGPRILSHRGAVKQGASVASEEAHAKPLQPASAKNQGKAAQKPAAPKATQSAKVSQLPTQVASPVATHDKQTGASQPDSQNKIAAMPAPAALRSEAAKVATPTNAGTKSSPGAAPGEVLEQVLPEPSEKAQATIHGKVRVGVKVHVDAAGSVTGAEFASPGPSKYFADLALQAARRWDFAPAKVEGHAVPSEWLIVFHFTPSGPKVFPTQSNP